MRSEAPAVESGDRGEQLRRSRRTPPAADRRPSIESATFFTTMVDFEEPGELGVFIDEEQLALVEESMKEKGYFDGAKMAEAFNLLRANDLIWSFVINNYLMGKDPFPFDLLYWNSDSTRMPRAMHSAYLRDMYQHNHLPGARRHHPRRRADRPRLHRRARLHPLDPRGPHRAVEVHLRGDSPLRRADPLRARDVGTHRGGREPSGREQVRLLHRRACRDAGCVARSGRHPRGLLVARLGRLGQRAGQGRGVPAREPGAGALPVIEDAPGRYVKVRIE